MQVADLVVNSSLLALVLDFIRSREQFQRLCGQPAYNKLRVRLFSMMGQLLRHATFLSSTIGDCGLFEALTEAVSDVDGPTNFGVQ